MSVPKVLRIVGLGVGLFLLTACMSGGAKKDAKEETENVAEEIASQWVNGNVNLVAEKLLHPMSEEHPKFVKIVKAPLAMVLKHAGEWEFVSIQDRDNPGEWRVTVTLRKDADLSKMHVDKIAKIAVAMDLWINTEKSTVERKSFNPAATSVNFQDI